MTGVGVRDRGETQRQDNMAAGGGVVGSDGRGVASGRKGRDAGHPQELQEAGRSLPWVLGRSAALPTSPSQTLGL